MGLWFDELFFGSWNVLYRDRIYKIKMQFS